MITREEIRELANFQLNGEADCAISFYFQPGRPRNKSHREESILTKDLVRDALRQAEKNGKNEYARMDLDHILELAATWHGNHTGAKALFACGSRKFWREFDLPPQLPGTQIFVNSRFHLKPLAVLLGAQPRLTVALVDRHKARFFDLRLGQLKEDELKEREGLFHSLPHRGRGDGFAGYDAGHFQRRVHDEALHHFKNVAEHLRQAHEKGSFDQLIIGCLDSIWHDLEPHLHSYVKKSLLGRFSADVATITNDQVRAHADRILRDALDQRRKQVVREVINQAKSNDRGVTGLRRVLRSLEMGEVQTLLLGENYSSHAVECSACGHLDAHLVRYCPVCGHSTKELEDVCDAIIPAVIRRDIELFYVKDDPEFDRVGNIAALLRFRADRSKAGITVAS
jgi:peptide subunit release factor 1 (eRF1)